MLICNNCGHTFEQAVKSREHIGEAWGKQIYEDWYLCPNCKGADWEEAKKCDCGEYIPAGADRCEHCQEVGEAALKLALEHIEKNTNRSYYEAMDLLSEIVEEKL